MSVRRYYCRMASAPHNPEPITVLDLFAGCGGLTEGFHQFRPEGTSKSDPPLFHSVGAVEWDEAAAASYAMNFSASSPRERHHAPTEIFCRDIIGWTPPWGEGEIDVVVGGPPCQGFSGLNRNKVGAERNMLWQEFIKVVVAVQPKVFVIENVDRFVRSPEFDDLKKRMGNGDLTNYTLRDAPDTKPGDTEQERARKYLLNAADYGSPQARRRAIVIGVRTNVDLRIDRMQYPQPKFSKELLDHQDTLAGLGHEGKQPWRTVDDTFGTTEAWRLTRTGLLDQTTLVAEVRRDLPGPFRTDELHFTRSPEPVSLARYKAIPPKGNRKDLRGRFWCRFDDGEEILIEKDGQFRTTEGKLTLFGSYTEVVDEGAIGTRKLSVAAWEPEPRFLLGWSGRSKAEAYKVVIRDNEVGRNATVVYLSTEAWDAHNAGAGDVMGRLRLGRPSVTIRTEFFKPEKGRYLHPTEDRPITHYEAARLQGFPDHFQWCGSKTDIAKQIGNAVPIPLGRAIAGSIYRYLRTGNERRKR